jgi:hypothetical protein
MRQRMCQEKLTVIGFTTESFAIENFILFVCAINFASIQFYIKT